MSTLQNAVNPQHYKSHPSGIECNDIRRYLKSNRSDAIKYLWRLGKKDESNQELKKAIWYLNDEVNNFDGVVIYTKYIADILDFRLNQLALYQSNDERELFNLIVFGRKESLMKAITIIEGMLDE